MNRLNEIRSQVERVLQADTDNFVELVEIAGLRPERDFRFANLSGVDFGTANLEGYDFTGACLKGCNFSKANYRYAIFDGARIDWETAFAEDKPERTQFAGLLSPDSIWLQTPAGDPVHLPLGSTALDYAYAIHPQVANKVIEIRVDGQAVPFGTVLRSGQCVEIKTSGREEVNWGWLDQVNTVCARREIRLSASSWQHNIFFSRLRAFLRKSLREIKDRDKRDWLAGGVNELFRDSTMRCIISEWARFDVYVLDSIAIGLICDPDKELRDVFHGPPTGGRRIVFCRKCFPLPNERIVGERKEREIVVHSIHCTIRPNGQTRHPFSWGAAMPDYDLSKNGLRTKARVILSMKRSNIKRKRADPLW